MFDSTLTSTRLRYCGIASCSMGYQKTPWSVAAEWEWLEVLQVSTEHMTCGSLQLRLTMAHSLLVTECVTVLLISVMISTTVLYTFAEWLLTVARREQTLMPTAQLDLCYKHSSQCNIFKIYQVSTCCILNILQVFHFCSWCSMIQRFQISGVSTLRFVDWCLIWPVVHLRLAATGAVHNSCENFVEAQKVLEEAWNWRAKLRFWFQVSWVSR